MADVNGTNGNDTLRVASKKVGIVTKLVDAIYLGEFNNLNAGGANVKDPKNMTPSIHAVTATHTLEVL